MRERVYRASVALLLIASLVILSQPLFHVSFTQGFLQELSLFASPVPSTCADGRLFDYSGYSLLTTGMPDVNRACLPDLQLHAGDGLGAQWPVVLFTAAVVAGLAVAIGAPLASRWFAWGVPAVMAVAAAAVAYENVVFWSSFAGKTGGLGADSSALTSQAGWPVWAEFSITLFLCAVMMVPRLLHAARAAIRPID